MYKNNDAMLPQKEKRFLDSLDDDARRFISFLRASLDGPYNLYFTDAGTGGDLRIRSSRTTQPFVLLTLVWEQQKQRFAAQVRSGPGSCEGHGFLSVAPAKDSQMRTRVTFNTDNDNIKKLIGVLPACVDAL